MPHFTRTRKARQDLLEIWRYIAADDPSAADKTLDAIDACCQLLSTSPRMGPVRNDIRLGLRYHVCGKHLIFYRILQEHIEIVRIVHARRDVGLWIDDESL